ncbi:MAG: hypothetical protein ACJA09_004016 [Alcanivorax sp.]
MLCRQFLSIAIFHDGDYGNLTPTSTARVGASSPQGDAAFACYVFNVAGYFL